MKRIRTQHITIVAGLIVLGILMARHNLAPTPVVQPSVPPETPVAQAPVQSTISPEAARFIYRDRSVRAEGEPSPEVPGLLEPLLEPDWAQLLKRHAEGDLAAWSEMMNALTPENALAAWESVRNAKLSPADRSRIYETLGKVGGGEVVRQMFSSFDSNAALAVRGWGQADPNGALDWYRQLDVFGNEQVQQYLKANHLNEQGFLDRLSENLLDSLLPVPDPKGTKETRDAYASEATRLIESLMENNPKKAEAMMRELTERFLVLYDRNTLSDWLNQLGNPGLQGAAIQRVIEAGAFKDAPLAAVDLAFSLKDPQSRGPAISAAFGKLGSGSGGVDIGAIAAELSAMPAGRDRDFAINGFAHGLAGTAPDTALAWAASISQPGFRDIVMRNVTRRIEGQASQKRK